MEISAKAKAMVRREVRHRRASGRQRVRRILATLKADPAEDECQNGHSEDSPSEGCWYCQSYHYGEQAATP